MAYQASTEEHSIDIVNIASLEGKVKERMEAGAFGYIRGGSEDEWTMKENTTSFNTKKIMLEC
ncbi:L-lactate oxidase [Enterococcus durans]|nr:L-lactate oxidase [Enterococcus durans]